MIIQPPKWFWRLWRRMNKLSPPRLSLPRLSLPHFSLPRLSLPRFSWPRLSLPRLSAPRRSLPERPLGSSPTRLALVVPVVVLVAAVALIPAGSVPVGGRETAAGPVTPAVAANTTAAPTTSASDPAPTSNAPASEPRAVLPPAAFPPPVAAPSTPARPAAVTPCGRFFDDFRYSSSRDGRLASVGWTVRAEAGGPGPRGAKWSPDAITFPAVDGEQVAQLTASTDGTAAGTTQSELFQNRQRFREGTYASRVRFSDAPVSGEDGDHLMQAYAALSPMNGDYDPLYSQLSFTEYTPNGAWGANGPLRSHASVYTLRPDPFDAKQAVTTVATSAAGWHTLVVQVGGGHVRYHLDGVQVADHTDDGEGHSVLPRQAMALHYNTWFVDLTGHRGGRSAYVQQVDWTYYAHGAIIAPGDVTTQAAAFRSGGVERLDTLPGTTTPCG